MSTARWRDLLRSVERDPANGIMLSCAKSDATHANHHWSHHHTAAAVAAASGMAPSGSDPLPGAEALARARMLRSPSDLPFGAFAHSAANAADDSASSAPPQPLLPAAESEGLTAALAGGASAEAVDGLVLQLVWRPALEAAAGLFLLGKAAGAAASPVVLRQVSDWGPLTQIR